MIKYLNKSTSSGVRKLFFQNATSPTIINGLFWYVTWIISRGSCIQRVLGVAIWRFLALWRLIPFLGYVKSTKDSSLMHNGCTTDAPWMLREYTMEAPRIYVWRTTDVWMHNGCTTNSFTCTMDAPGKPHRCTTDALWTHYGCTRNASCMLYGCASDTI